jgi:hypothetical protein
MLWKWSSQPSHDSFALQVLFILEFRDGRWQWELPKGGDKFDRIRRSSGRADKNGWDAARWELWEESGVWLAPLSTRVALWCYKDRIKDWRFLGFDNPGGDRDGEYPSAPNMNSFLVTKLVDEDYNAPSTKEKTKEEKLRYETWQSKHSQGRSLRDATWITVERVADEYGKTQSFHYRIEDANLIDWQVQCPVRSDYLNEWVGELMCDSVSGVPYRRKAFPIM